MRKISFPFLWLLVFIMPWEDIFAIPGLTSLAKIFGMLAFLLGLTGALFSGRVRLPFVLVWVALFSGWCAVSSQWAPDPEMPLQRAATYVLLLTFVWLICELADDPKRLKSLMRACVLGTAMIVVNTYLGYVHAGVPLNTEGEVRYTAEGANANLVAFFCSLSILFAFYLITRRKKGGFELPDWFYWGFIVAASLAVLLTGSRAGALSLGIVGFVVLGRLWKVNWRVRLGLIASVVFVGLLVPRLVSRSTIERIAEGTSGDTFTVRTNAWQVGLKVWKETPLLGVGAGCYTDMMAKQGERAMVAHNTLVSVLVESGLVGFILYFSFWGVVIRRVMLLPKVERFFWLGVIASYLPAFLSGSMEYQKLWWFLGALVLCQASQPKVADANTQKIVAPPVRAPGLPLPNRPQQP